MRVFIDGRGMRDHPTGAGKALTHLLRQLRADFPGHEYRTCAPDGVEAWRLARRLVWEQAALPWHARRAGADVLHVPSGSAGPIVGGVRTVMTIHDLAPTRWPELL